MSRRPTSRLDRRSGSDRRRDDRFPISQPIVWEGPSGVQDGTLSDISVSGCFVLGSGDVVDGDRVRIDFPLMVGGVVSLAAEVVNHVQEIGYGARFVDLSSPQQVYLDRLTDSLRAD